MAIDLVSKVMRFLVWPLSIERGALHHSIDPTWIHAATVLAVESIRK
jgi:hypothetical protein